MEHDRPIRFTPEPRYHGLGDIRSHLTDPEPQDQRNRRKKGIGSSGEPDCGNGSWGISFAGDSRQCNGLADRVLDSSQLAAGLRISNQLEARNIPDRWIHFIDSGLINRLCTGRQSGQVESREGITQRVKPLFL